MNVEVLMLCYVVCVCVCVCVSVCVCVQRSLRDVVLGLRHHVQPGNNEAVILSALLSSALTDLSLCCYWSLNVLSSIFAVIGHSLSSVFAVIGHSSATSSSCM